MTRRGIKTRIVAGVAAVVAVIAFAACSGEDTDDERSGSDRQGSTEINPYELKVLTRNLYLGADLTPIFEAAPADLGAAIRATYDQMMASDVDGRLDAVAREIVDNRPDLVALQEASLWSIVPPGVGPDEVIFDFLQILLAKLEERGARYTVVATVDGFNGGLPVADVGMVTLLDRDVILVRERSAIDITATAAGTFESRLTLTVAGVPIEIARGWASVDARLGDRSFRLIGTHLEAFDDAVRDQQQQELMSVTSASTLPTLVLGDLNSAAQGGDSRAYDNTLAAGFSDAWTKAPAEAASSTCCRTADLTGGSYRERIDFVLYRGSFEPLGAELVGNDAISRTAGGLWASDHAGVIAVLEIDS